MVELTVAFRAQPCITAVNKFGVAEFLEDCFFQWFKGLLLVLVSRKDGEGQGYPISVREHSHLYDGVRAVFLALPIPFCPVFLLNFEVIVRAVVIKDPVIPVCQEVAVLEGLRLYKVAFLCKDIQGAVDVMPFIGRLFEIVHCRPVRGTLASGFQYPGVYQARQDGIEVIPELMPFPDLPAGPVKSEPVINRLQEKVSALIKLLAVVIQLPVGMERDKDRPGLIFLFILFGLQPCLFPCPCHYIITGRAVVFEQVVKGSELTDNRGCAYTFFIDEAFRYVK